MASNAVFLVSRYVIPDGELSIVGACHEEFKALDLIDEDRRLRGFSIVRSFAPVDIITIQHEITVPPIMYRRSWGSDAHGMILTYTITRLTEDDLLEISDF
jgi:hypothetical protein